MSLSLMKRSAPLGVLCCGGGFGSFIAAARSLPQNREDDLDGCTEVEALEVLESRPQLPELEEETRQLLGQFFRSHIGLSNRSTRHPALQSLRRVTEKLLSTHMKAYRGMVQRLFEQANGLDSVDSVLSGVFSDGVMSWGRIASVLALGAVVCERMKQTCVKENVEECVDVVVSKISSFVCTELRHWFIKSNSWDGFVEFFHVEDPESTVRTTLMAAAGLGIGGIGVCLFSLMR